jgi:hypothetical protein
MNKYVELNIFASVHLLASTRIQLQHNCRQELTYYPTCQTFPQMVQQAANVHPPD